MRSLAYASGIMARYEGKCTVYTSLKGYRPSYKHTPADLTSTGGWGVLKGKKRKDNCCSHCVWMRESWGYSNKPVKE